MWLARHRTDVASGNVVATVGGPRPACPIPAPLSDSPIPRDAEDVETIHGRRDCGDRPDGEVAAEALGPGEAAPVRPPVLKRIAWRPRRGEDVDPVRTP